MHMEWMPFLFHPGKADQDLNSAMKLPVNWYFQELIRSSELKIVSGIFEENNMETKQPIMDYSIHQNCGASNIIKKI